MTNSSSSHAWADLPSRLATAIPVAKAAANEDGQLKAFTRSDAINAPASFGIKAAGSDSTIVVTVSNGKTDVRTGESKECLFVLSALPEQWEEFFKQTPVAPYQRYE